MLAILKSCAAAALTLAVLCGAAQADPIGLISFNSYRMENRPDVVFPGNRVHVSPYPMSKRAASVWTSDACWRTCTAETSFRYELCSGRNGLEACRYPLDADNRACLRACRTRGGPMLNLAD